MKTTNLLLLSVVLLGLNGCKLLKHRDEATEPEKVLDTSPKLGTAPNFDIPIDDGFSRKVFYGQLKASKTVTVDNIAGSRVRVFIKDNVGWFLIPNQYADAYWYDRIENKITYHNTYAFQEYCIYEDIPL